MESKPIRGTFPKTGRPPVFAAYAVRMSNPFSYLKVTVSLRARRSNLAVRAFAGPFPFSL
jgi:hypothetical protein